MTVSELNTSEFRQIGPDLVLHTPTSLVIHTGSESSPARFVDIVAVKDGEFPLFEEWKVLLIRQFADPFLSRVGSNFITAYYLELASRVTPEELLVCGKCKVVCFTSPPPPGIHEYHMTGYCAGSTEPLIKCKGFRIHGKRFLFVVLQESSVSTSKQVISNQSASSTEMEPPSAMENAMLSIMDPSDPTTPVYRTIGKGLVLHTKHQLVFLCNLRVHPDPRIINPSLTLAKRRAFINGLYEHEEALKKPRYPWSPYYNMIFDESDTSNYRLIDTDPTLSIEPLVCTMQICGGCKRVCVGIEERAKMNPKWAAHIAKSPSCSNAEKIPCRGLRTSQKNVNFLVFKEDVVTFSHGHINGDITSPEKIPESGAVGEESSKQSEVTPEESSAQSAVDDIVGQEMVQLEEPRLPERTNPLCISVSKMKSLLPDFIDMVPGILLHFIEQELRPHSDIQCYLFVPESSLVVRCQGISISMNIEVDGEYSSDSIRSDILIRIVDDIDSMPLDTLRNVTGTATLEVCMKEISVQIMIFLAIIKEMAGFKGVTKESLKKMVKVSFGEVRIGKDTAWAKVGAYLATEFPET